MRAALNRSFLPLAGGDRGDIVLSWLTKLTVTLALVGIVLFDAISIGTTNATVSDQGSYAAHEASETWDRTKDLQETYDAAVAAAVDRDPENVVSPNEFRVDPDGTVHLVVTRVAPTLILYRWDRTAEWAKVSRPAKGRSVG
jgi:hypothetical protein